MTLIEAEDERHILRLYALYCHYFNAGEAEDWARLFTESGSFTRLYTGAKQHGNFGNPAGTTSGTGKLVELLKARREVFKGRVHHQQTDMVVSPGIDADHAKGRSLMLVTDWRDGPGRLAGCAACTSEFVRTPEGWRFENITLATFPRAEEEAATPAV